MNYISVQDLGASGKQCTTIMFQSHGYLTEGSNLWQLQRERMHDILKKNCYFQPICQVRFGHSNYYGIFQNEKQILRLPLSPITELTLDFLFCQLIIIYLTHGWKPLHNINCAYQCITGPLGKFNGIVYFIILTNIIGTGTLEHCPFDQNYW